MKKIRLMLVMAVMLVSVIAGVNVSAAGEGFVRRANQSGVTVVSYEDEMDADLVFAQYDDDGRLESVKVCPITVENGENYYDYASLGFGEEFPDGAKVMLWNEGGIEPLFVDEAEMVKRTDIIKYQAGYFRGYVQDGTVASYSNIQFFADETKTTFVSYKISTGAEMYINGEKVQEFDWSGIPWNYPNNTFITITDIPDELGIYDGKYDRIDLDVYMTGFVDWVENDDEYKYIVYFYDNSDTIDRIHIDYNNMYYNYSVYLDGKYVSPSKIQAGDVLSIMYKNTDIVEEYDIYISRNTYTGKLMVTDVNRGEYTFDNGEKYKLSYAGAAKLENGNVYTLYFDIFGQIAYAEEIEQPAQIAILNDVYESVGEDEYYVEIITSEAVKRYSVDYDEYCDLLDVLMYDDNVKADIKERVIEYKIKANGRFSLRNVLECADVMDGNYKEPIEKIDGIKINDTTVLVDISEYATDGVIYKISKDMLIDGGEYYAYNFETRDNSLYNFVLVVSKPAEVALGDEIIYVPDEEEKVEISSEGYVIVHNVYEDSFGDYCAAIIASEGKVTYPLKNKMEADALADVVAPGNTVDTLSGAAKAAVQNRVIEYKINANGELVPKEQADGRYNVVGTAICGEYNALESKLDTKYVSDEITSFIDVSGYCADCSSDVYSVKMSELIENYEYIGYAFGEAGSNNTAVFVLITGACVGLNVNSNMAIYVSGGQQSIDGQDVEAITAYVGGELTTLVDDDAAYNMNPGDVFFYTLDKDVYIDELYPVMTSKVDTTYDEFYTKLLGNGFGNMIDADMATGFNCDESDDTASTIKFNKYNPLWGYSVRSGCELVFGAIVEASSIDVSIATNVKNVNAYDIYTATEYDLADDAVIYKYDYDVYKPKNRVEKTASAVFKYSIPQAAFADDTMEILDFESDKLLWNGSNWTNANYGRIRLALLKVVDDEVTEAIVYIPSTSRD